MKKRKFIINILIIFLLSGCQQIVSNEEYINLSAMLKENKDKLELADSYVDYSEYGIENNDQNNFEMEVGNIASLGLLYFRFKKIGNSKFNFRQVSYIQMPDMFYVHAYELKSNKAAINAYNKICNENVESVYDRLKVKNNILYSDDSYSNILLSNVCLEGDNYLTLDGTGFLANLSFNETITIPNVEEIKATAFSKHTSLKNVYMCDSLKQISQFAFASCYNLENVYLNYGLKSIERGAFVNCKSLNYVVLPDTVKYIGSQAFTHGTIFSNTTFTPDTWARDFAVGNCKVYYKNQWYYDKSGIPTPKDNI